MGNANNDSPVANSKKPKRVQQTTTNGNHNMTFEIINMAEEQTQTVPHNVNAASPS